MLVWTDYTLERILKFSCSPVTVLHFDIAEYLAPYLSHLSHYNNVIANDIADLM